MTLIPLKIYFKNGKAKLLVGVACGKAAHDKRSPSPSETPAATSLRAMSKRM